MQNNSQKIDSNLEHETCFHIKIVLESRFRWKTLENNDLEFIAVLKVRARPQGDLSLSRPEITSVFFFFGIFFPALSVSQGNNAVSTHTHFDAIKNLINL